MALRKLRPPRGFRTVPCKLLDPPYTGQPSTPMPWGLAFSTAIRAALLAFFDFPAEHWGHLRTSNPIESVFATVRHRTVRTKGALSQKTAKLMVFTLIQAASKKWLRLKGRKQLPKVIEGIKFTDGVEVTNDTENRAA